MKLFEWLLDYQKLENEISYLDYNLTRNKKELQRWTVGDLKEVKLHPDSNGAKLEEIIFSIEYELAHKINDLYEAKRLISTFKGLDNQILYKRYVEGKSLENVATELNYSYSHISKKHAELIRTLKYIDSFLFNDYCGLHE